MHQRSRKLSAPVATPVHLKSMYQDQRPHCKSVVDKYVFAAQGQDHRANPAAKSSNRMAAVHSADIVRDLLSYRWLFCLRKWSKRSRETEVNGAGGRGLCRRRVSNQCRPSLSPRACRVTGQNLGGLYLLMNRIYVNGMLAAPKPGVANAQPH